jgi:hypothetical protein
MIPQKAYFYGAALYQLLGECGDAFQIERIEGDSSCVFVVDNSLPLLLKYSSNKSSPWAFTFHASHLNHYIELVEEYGTCVLVLVCGFDGVIALNSDEVDCIFKLTTISMKNIKVARKHNEMFQVNGTDGELNHKVARDSLMKLVKQFLDGAK